MGWFGKPFVRIQRRWRKQRGRLFLDCRIHWLQRRAEPTGGQRRVSTTHVTTRSFLAACHTRLGLGRDDGRCVPKCREWELWRTTVISYTHVEDNRGGRQSHRISSQGVKANGMLFGASI